MKKISKKVNHKKMKMKKIALSLAVVAAMLLSCKEATTEVENTIDSTTTKIEETASEVIDSTTAVVDSVTAKVEETAKVSLKRIDE
jgi:PBP1b-binding outer membrane lipoprotein LpoB